MGKITKEQTMVNNQKNFKRLSKAAARRKCIKTIEQNIGSGAKEATYFAQVTRKRRRQPAVCKRKKERRCNWICRGFKNIKNWGSKLRYRCTLCVADSIRMLRCGNGIYV